MSDFTNCRVGQKIGVKPKYSYQQGETVVGEIVDETPKYWVVSWSQGINQTQKFNKKTGVDFPRDYRELCTEQEAIDTIGNYHERKDREYSQRIAGYIDCIYSESFQNDLLALIKKHKRTK